MLASYPVREVFPVEGGKDLTTAKSWATGHHWQNKNNYIPEIIETDNVPISDVRVVTLEHRGNGGRAYKVIINGFMYADIREDVIIDTMLNCGIEKGAILNGQFIWAKNKTQMKLIRVGSALYKQFSKNVDTSKAVDIPKSSVVPGGVYEMKSGSVLIYFGKFETYKFKHDGEYRHSYPTYAYDIYNGRFVKEFVHVFLRQDALKKLNTDLYSWEIELKRDIPKFIKIHDPIDISNIDILGAAYKAAEREIKTYERKLSNIYSVANYCPDYFNLGVTAKVHEYFIPINVPIHTK